MPLLLTMRTGMVLAGSLLLLLGVGMTIGGGFMKDVGDTCLAIRCGDPDMVLMGALGQGIFGGGLLVGLAGTALLVAGLLAARRDATAIAREPYA